MTFRGETEFLPLPPMMDYKANNIKKIKIFYRKIGNRMV